MMDEDDDLSGKSAEELKAELKQRIQRLIDNPRIPGSVKGILRDGDPKPEQPQERPAPPPTRIPVIPTPPIPKPVANERPPAKSLLEIYEMAASDGPAVLPAGQAILGILGWDTYRNYYESDSRLNYAWKVSLAILAHDESAARFRQTIHLFGNGTHRIHEAAFAFNVEDLGDSKVVPFRGPHPGAGSIPIPGMYSGLEPASIQSKGPPVGVELTFRKPVIVRRWSCMPITSGVIDQEMSVFQITVWFATQATAEAAVETLKALTEKTPSSTDRTPTTPRSTPAAPRFEEFPAIPPGGISRL